MEWIKFGINLLFIMLIKKKNAFFFQIWNFILMLIKNKNKTFFFLKKKRGGGGGGGLKGVESVYEPPQGGWGCLAIQPHGLGVATSRDGTRKFYGRGPAKEKILVF
jgi:hypothetical protein